MKNLVTALIAAQRDMGPVLKDRDNPFFKSQYATLGSAWDACKEALWANGLTVVQTVRRDEVSCVLVSSLVHSSGESLDSVYPLMPAKERDPQAFGSCITYARRYSLLALIGLVPEDDDGNEASGRGPAPANKGPHRAAEAAPTPVPAPKNRSVAAEELYSPPHPTVAAAENVFGAKAVTKSLSPVQRLAMAMERSGLTDRDARLAWLSEQLGRAVRSSAELTPEELARMMSLADKRAADKRAQGAA